MTATAQEDTERKGGVSAFLAGMGIGTLGGLIGLGGAEFRLPLLIGLFRFGPLEAVIVNKAMSLVVVASALPFRTGTIPFAAIADHWLVIANLLAGSLFGAWVGAAWATRLRRKRSIASSPCCWSRSPACCWSAMARKDRAGRCSPARPRWWPASSAGFVIGVVASLLGVAGGELLIPTLILLFGADVKLAGSLSLAVSLPTMLVGFARYSRDSTFAVLGRNRWFVIVMAAGSIAGSLIGALLLGIVPGFVLLPVLAAILLVSAVKVWRHK